MDDGMLRVVCECVFHFNTPKILHIPWYLHFFSNPATTVRVTRSSSTSSTCTSSGDELAMVATSRFGRRHLFAADGRFPCTRSTRTEPSQAHPKKSFTRYPTLTPSLTPQSQQARGWSPMARVESTLRKANLRPKTRLRSESPSKK